MTLLVTKSQAAIKIEATEGTAETLAAADLIGVVTRDFPRVSVSAPATPRQIASGTAGAKPGIGGGREATVPLLMELSPNKTSLGVPEWSIPLRACGMYYAACKKHAVAASWTSGTKVSHGATFVADSSGAEGRIIGDYWEGEDLFLVYEVIGTQAITGADTDLTVTFQGSTQAEVTLSSAGTIANAYAWYPSVTPISQVTITAVGSGPINLGDELSGATSGAKGRCANPDGINAGGVLQVELFNGSPAFTASETINVVGGSATATVSGTPGQTQRQVPSVTVQTINGGRRMRMQGTRGTWSLLLVNKEQGIWTFNFTGVPLQPDEVDMLTFVRNSASPPNVKGGSLLFDSDFAPRFQQVGFSANNVVNLREDPSQASGHYAAEISDYAHQMTLDPESVESAIKDWWDDQFDKTQLRAKHVIGSGSGGTFEIRQAYVQVEELAHAERSNRLTDSLTLNATSGDELEHPGGTVILHY